VFLARRLAQERDGVTTLAMASFGVADELLCGGALKLGLAELDSLSLPPTTIGTAGLVGQVVSTHAFAAVVQGRLGDTAAPIDAAADVADRFGNTGQVDAQGFVFGPVDAALFRMRIALEADDPDQAISVAQHVDPERHPFPVNRSKYWVHYGRALTQLRRQDDAVRALRTAEDLFPTGVRRDRQVRAALGELLTRSQRDAAGVELRGMAHRAGLPV
jgi:hypothetical protein